MTIWPAMNVRFLAAVALSAALPQAVLDDRSIAAFLGELQRRMVGDDRAAVSALVQFPLTVFAGGIRIPIRDAAALQQNYDIVFPAALKSLIAQAALPGRAPSRSSASVVISPGFATIGVDAVRIEPVGDALRITRITVPLAAPSPGGDRRIGGGDAREPQKILVDFGRVQRTGALGTGERDAYLVSAAKNRLLEVRINGVAGRDIVARIVNLKTRAPIDSRAQDGVRTWVGRIPEDGTYRIDVVRLAPAGGSRLEYLMIVALR
jgi:hypothetical protein